MEVRRNVETEKTLNKEEKIGEWDGKILDLQLFNGFLDEWILKVKLIKEILSMEKFYRHNAMQIFFSRNKASKNTIKNWNLTSAFTNIFQ